MRTDTIDLPARLTQLAETEDFAEATALLQSILRDIDCHADMLVGCIEKGFALEQPEEQQQLFELLLAGLWVRSKDLKKLFGAAFVESVHKGLQFDMPVIYEELGILEHAFRGAPLEEQLDLIIWLLDKAKEGDDRDPWLQLVGWKIFRGRWLNLPEKSPASRIQTIMMDSILWGKGVGGPDYAACVRVIKDLVVTYPRVCKALTP